MKTKSIGPKPRIHMQCVVCGVAVRIKRTGRSDSAECTCACGQSYAYSAWTVATSRPSDGARTRYVDKHGRTALEALDDAEEIVREMKRRKASK